MSPRTLAKFSRTSPVVYGYDRDWRAHRNAGRREDRNAQRIANKRAFRFAELVHGLIRDQLAEFFAEFGDGPFLNPKLEERNG